MKLMSAKIFFLVCAFATLCLIMYVTYQKDNVATMVRISNVRKSLYEILKKQNIILQRTLHRAIAGMKPDAVKSVTEASKIKTYLYSTKTKSIISLTSTKTKITSPLVSKKIFTAIKTTTTSPYVSKTSGSSTALPTLIMARHTHAIIKKINWKNIPDWVIKYAWNTLTFTECEVNTCRLEPDHRKADVVILNMVGFRQNTPAFRPTGQIWVLFGLESPFNSQSEVLRELSWKSQINWTMTYRLDSSFPFPYGNVTHRPVNERPNLKQVIMKKKKLVAWVVSNCHLVYSGRQEYVQLLNKHLREPVDIYGKCGTLKAENDVFKKIDREYKFYLGFENSLCKDYVTEKFHLSQRMNLIVIVRGMGNYSHFYPKTSYIDTRDFNSTKQLADYIHYLDTNDTAYLKYLRNKAPYKINLDDMKNNICEMCKRLHQPIIIPTYYPDIGAWWYNNTCTKPTDLV